MGLVISAIEELARIRDALRRVFLDDAGGEREAVGRVFDQAGELSLSELTLLRRAEEERAAFAHRDVTFALAAATRGGAIQLPGALVERVDLRRGQEIARWRARPRRHRLGS